MPRNSNTKVVPGSGNILDQMKFEVAGELGIPDYNSINKGDLPSRVNGYVGGNITKRLVALGQQAIMNQGAEALNQATQVPLETGQTQVQQ